MVTQTITENKFSFQGGIIVYDVGGQRGLRKQWMPFFDFVNNIIFVADMSCYDQVMEEDGEVNRMVDALDLFKKISNAPLLVGIPLVLMLNKMDLLEKKLEYSPVNRYFSDYQGISSRISSFF
jgi:hypothetical protein